MFNEGKCYSPSVSYLEKQNSERQNGIVNIMRDVKVWNIDTRFSFLEHFTFRLMDLSELTVGVTQRPPAVGAYEVSRHFSGNIEIKCCPTAPSCWPPADCTEGQRLTIWANNSRLVCEDHFPRLQVPLGSHEPPHLLWPPDVVENISVVGRCWLKHSVWRWRPVILALTGRRLLLIPCWDESSLK